MDISNKQQILFYLRKAWDYFCYFYSTILYLTCVAIVLYGIIENKTIFVAHMPFYANVIVFVILLFLLGCLEGMQICIIRLMSRRPDLYKNEYKIAWNAVEIAQKPKNLERFLQGRQLLVTIIAFLLTQLTTIVGADVFPAWLESAFLSTGLLGAIVVVIGAQLSSRVIAISYPVQFLNRIILNIIFRLCLVVEFVGFAYCAWLVAGFIKIITRLKSEKVETGNELTEVVTNHGEHDFAQHFSLNQLAIGEINKDDSQNLSLPDYSLPLLVGDQHFPSAEQLAQKFESNGVPLPAFLLDPSNPKYVPPHAYACILLGNNQAKIGRLGNAAMYPQRFGEVSKAELTPESYPNIISKMVSLLIPA